MHEFSLAGEIIRATSEKVRDMRGAPCTCLRFCLEAARAGTLLEGLGVEVETVRPRLVCPACGEVEYTGRFDIVCPQCGGRISGVVGGRVLDVQLECGAPRARTNA